MKSSKDRVWNLIDTLGNLLRPHWSQTKDKLFEAIDQVEKTPLEYEERMYKKFSYELSKIAKSMHFNQMSAIGSIEKINCLVEDFNRDCYLNGIVPFMKNFNDKNSEKNT